MKRMNRCITENQRIELTGDFLRGGDHMIDAKAAWPPLPSVHPRMSFIFHTSRDMLSAST